MRECLRQIRDTGESDSIRGYAVTRLHASDDYARTDFCLAGFRALTDRICPHIDSKPLLRLEQRFAVGSPLTIELIDDALRMLRIVEDELMKHTVEAVKDAVLTEQVSIELDALAEHRKAA
jgi:hypothetical protein